jgi:transcriptional regulator with XRE-family HTH domain
LSSKRKRRNVTGEKIQRLRIAAQPKITQQDMAGRLARVGLDMNQSQVAKIESGERMIADFEVIAFAKALRVPVQELFG